MLSRHPITIQSVTQCSLGGVCLWQPYCNVHTKTPHTQKTQLTVVNSIMPATGPRLNRPCISCAIIVFLSSPKNLPLGLLRTDKTESKPYDVILRIIEAELGQPWSNVFDSIDPTPLASASVAQVHSAVLKGSKKQVRLRGSCWASWASSSPVLSNLEWGSTLCRAAPRLATKLTQRTYWQLRD